MKKRLFSLLLCLVMVLSLFPAFGMSAAAADANGITNPEPAKGADDELNLTKSLAPGENGTYDLTLESWATGEVTTDTVTEKVPTDFVIVVDQSGSMKEEDMATGGYTAVSNQYLETIADSSTPYYYKDGDQYYRVYAKRGYLYEYHAANTLEPHDIKDHCNVDLAFFSSGSTSVDSTTPFGQYYYKDGDQMRLLYLTFIRRWDILAWRNRFSLQLYYLDDSNNKVYFIRPADRDIQIHWGTNLGDWWATADGNTDYNFQNSLGNGVYINYPMFARYMGYTELCYQDVEGVEHVIPTTNGTQTTQYCDTSSAHNAITDYQNGQRMQYSGLYTASGMESRLAALKSALNSFASAVANEEDDFGPVDNKVSIVGFSSPGYSNTELLTHTERNVSGNNGWQKNTCDGNVSEYYGKGLVPVIAGDSAGTVNQKVTAAIGAITANGGTQPEDGLDMAYKVLDNRSATETDYTIRGGDRAGDTVPRNQVVIFFTDGRPGNNDSYDQYVEANEVVVKAKDIKQELGATIFSIGVFGESDGNPLTYPVSKNSGSVYDLGYVSDCEADSDYYLYRQWRANDAANYGAAANDTIFSYMSVVSSNYPDADGFITQAWINGNHSGTYLHATDDYRHKENAEATNKYYRMASNQQSLIDAFLQAATMNSESIHSDTAVPLDATAVFKDDVNLSDFDIAGATYTVQWQPVKMVGDELQNDGAAETKVDAQPVPANGKIEYTGFDYSGNYVTTANSGQKLVVTINGLTPKKAGATLYSNDGDAGIYGDGEEDPTVQIASPTLTLSNNAEQSCVIDFNGKMILAREANEPKNATSNNGEFGLEGTSAYYQLRNDGLKASSKDASAVLNSDYDGVDTAMIYGKFDSDTNKQWKQVTAIPASNIYYSDNLTEATLAVNDQIGYNEGVTYVAPTAESANKTYSFTFTGSRIDVYATTTPGTKTVTATLYQNGEKVAEKMVNTKVPTDATRVSAPSVSFDGLSGTYTLEIFANVKANFLLEAVRVYNANEANAEVEPNARYINLRDMVLDKESADELENETPDAVLFMDEVKSENPYQEGTDAYRQYIPQTYEALGPKNEVYLAPGQAIGFEVASGVDVMVSLRSPETESGTVMINGDEQAVTNVDMYYPVTLDDGVVMIRNESEDMISVINVKLTTAEADGSRAMIFSSPKLLARAAQYVAPAAAEVNDEPVIPDFSAIIRQLISDFVRTLFSSISRLFGN